MRRNAVWRDKPPDDVDILHLPTRGGAGHRQEAHSGVFIVRCMDEPTQVNESLFWDQVADWLLDARAYDEIDLSDADIESMLRGLPGDPDGH